MRAKKKGLTSEIRLATMRTRWGRLSYAERKKKKKKKGRVIAMDTKPQEGSMQKKEGKRNGRLSVPDVMVSEKVRGERRVWRLSDLRGRGGIAAHGYGMNCEEKDGWKRRSGYDRLKRGAQSGAVGPKKRDPLASWPMKKKKKASTPRFTKARPGEEARNAEGVRRYGFQKERGGGEGLPQVSPEDAGERA